MGFWVEAYPDLTKEIHERGFEIGTHSQTHPNLPKLSEAGIREELTKSISLITAQTGVPVTLFRAPFGDYDNKLITICEDMGIKTIQWDVDTLDWKGLSGEQITLRVEKRSPGGIDNTVPQQLQAHNRGVAADDKHADGKRIRIQYSRRADISG